MSLILDALKKSEAERQRQSGPTLLEVRITQPRRRYPAWAIAVGALLAVNMLLLLAFVLHRPASSPAPSPQAAAATPAAVAAPGPPPAAAPAAAAGAAPGSVAAMAQGARADAVAADGATTLAGNSDTMGPRTWPGPEAGADGPDSAHNPADDEPALPAAAGTARSERDNAAHYAGLPSFSDLSGDLPQLRLDLHVYTANARDRYALINMHRVREGDALPEGPRVLAITREGVALDYRGQEFMLHPQ